jgi:hypothetical protein
VFGWVFAKQADQQMPEVRADGPARRGLTDANTLSEDRRFELACYALTDGFMTSLMLRGPGAWQADTAKGAASRSRRRRT